MRLFQVILLCLFVSVQTYAQQVKSTGAESDYGIYDIMGPMPSGLNSFYSITKEQSVVVVQQGSVYPVQFGKRSFGLAMVDHKGNPKWQAVTKGFIIGLAKLNGQVVCFYSAEGNEGVSNAPLTTLYAAMYNLKNGQLISEDAVFQNTTKNYVDPRVLLTPDSSFAFVMLRHTQSSGPKFLSAKEQLKMTSTEKLSAVSYDKDGRFKTTEIPSQAIGTRFIASAALSPTELVIASEKDDQVTIERFSTTNLSAVRKSTFTESISTKRHPTGKLKIRPGISTDIFLVIAGEDRRDKNQIIIARVAQSAEQVKVSKIELNKEFAASIKEEGGAKGNRLARRMDIMKFVDLAFYGDKTLVLSQAHQIGFPASTATRSMKYENSDILISEIDGEMKYVRSTVVNRFLYISSPLGQRFGHYIDEGRMHLLYNKIEGPMQLAAEYAVVDLSNLKVISQTPIAKDGLKSTAMIEPECVVWRKQTAVLPYYNKFGGAIKEETIFQEISLMK